MATFTSTTSPTPFGSFDSDSAFQTDADAMKVFVKRKLGDDILSVELTNKQIWACFEESVFEYGKLEDGTCFLALEYVAGQRFTDLVNEGPMAPERLVELMLQVCQALRYAHRRGVVHRDLKPSNLLVWTDEPHASQTRNRTFNSLMGRVDRRDHATILPFLF